MVRPAPRLPGIYVETVRPPRADALPRMDVAAFVGFAAAGPLHLPVAVEDVARFREVFGPDLILARDEAREREQSSLMGPTVEAFFANGGRRAFILRVADADEARTLSFDIPGLADVHDTAAVARARSPGLQPAELAADTRLVRARLFPAPSGGLARTISGLALPIAPGTKAPRPGDLIEATFEDAGLIALLVVAAFEGGVLTAQETEVFWRRPVAASPSTSPPGSPPESAALGIDDAGLEAVDRNDQAVQDLLDTTPAPNALSVLTFDLVLWEGARLAHRLNGLGFASAHPRYWAALPDDATLFAEATGRASRPLGPELARFLAEVSSPRFPLAGPVAAPAIWLPNGMTTATDQSRAQAPVLPPGTRLEAEGLAAYSDALFLDSRLARTNALALGAEMEAVYADEARTGQALAGLHALAPVSEVSMLAVPDSVHRNWTRAIESPPPPLVAPRLERLPDKLDPFARLALAWTPVTGANQYRVEIASAADFADARPVTAPVNSAAVPLESNCPVPVAVRVRAERRGEVGPWSNTRLGRVPAEDFDQCDTPDPDRLSLLLSVDEASSPGPALVWAFEPPEAALPGDRYELQSGAAPGLDDGMSVAIDGGVTEHLPDPILDGALYFRVRVLRGAAAGPWSETVRIGPSGRSDWTLLPEAEYQDGTLTAIHRAMIRFAAGRADAVALLSLPRHYREPEIESHLARLSPLIDDIAADSGGDDAPAGTLLVPGLRFGEEGALSYAALQHPWLSTADSSSQGFQPPDGAMAGLMARRAQGAGAWIAAANLPVAGALGLDPPLDDATLARLIALQVNPVRRDPRGFLIFNAETLSPADDLRPLPVRRLMILLRRLALREGRAYVFEPHDADFRALVRRRFERVLSLIHERGGFAGDTPEASFQVVTDASVNPPTAVELGRFVVELRVAPSRPFRYLNVRLLRTGPERLSVQEA